LLFVLHIFLSIFLLDNARESLLGQRNSFPNIGKNEFAFDSVGFAAIKRGGAAGGRQEYVKNEATEKLLQTASESKKTRNLLREKGREKIQKSEKRKSRTAPRRRVFFNQIGEKIIIDAATRLNRILLSILILVCVSGGKIKKEFSSNVKKKRPCVACK